MRKPAEGRQAGTNAVSVDDTLDLVVHGEILATGTLGVNYSGCVAGVQQEVALLDAQRIEILGKARADVEKLSKAAEAQGYRLLVDAFGTPQAYNLYTFAEGFQPESIRLFFAGDGTFWTDLTRFEELGGARLLQAQQGK